VQPIAFSANSGVTSKQHAIDISFSETGLDVEETLLINNSGTEAAITLRFWIQQGISNLVVHAVESGVTLDFLMINSNVRECNLSTYSLEIPPSSSMTLKFTYTLPTNTENFEKSILYPTDSISVTFNDEALYKATDMQKDSSITLRLYRPTEAPLGLTYIAIIILLVIILIVSTLLLLRKQRGKVKKSISDSREVLSTKKTLLLSLLKDIEKQHRAKQLSDDTYNKLKDEYKKQAVDVMKKLEDLKKL
jgi:hypothetical protein